MNGILLMGKYGRLAIFVLIFASTVLGLTFFAAADKPIEPADIAKAKMKPPKRIDADKNKIYDDLEEKLKGKIDSDAQDVIIVFDHKLSDAENAEVTRKTTDKKPTHRYAIIPGMAITLSKREINDLASSPLIKQIEDDAEVRPFLDNSTKWF